MRNTIYGQLFNGNGTKIGSEFQANSYTTFDQEYPSVASFSNGNFVVTWQSDGQDGLWHEVYGQLFGNGSKIGSEFRANSYVTLNQQHPSVASFSNGNFVVTWNSDRQDGSGSGVYGQLFSGDGSKIGNEFQVNTYTTNDQSGTSVASLSNGNFVVTWNSDRQDGSGSGVYGQIFHDNITYPSTSTTTSSSITSTTKTTSSTTSSVTSSTTSTTTTSSTTSSVSSRIMSDTSDLKKRFSWVWFLLGGVGAVSCLGLTGYFIFKSRDRQNDGDVIASELGESEQAGALTVETQYRSPLIT